MTSIVFEPWVGQRFLDQAPRLLLLGETHYGEPYPVPALATHYVVEQWRSRQWRVRYLVAAARLLSGLSRWELDTETALERIAFYNYVQFMMPTVKDRPTSQQFQQSEEAFREVLEKLNPTHILVTGKTLWKEMPHFDVEGVSGRMVALGTEQMEIGQYSTPSGTALVTLIPHLSRFFSPIRWNTPVAEFLALMPDRT